MVSDVNLHPYVKDPIMLKGKMIVSGELDCAADVPLRASARVPTMMLMLAGAQITLADFYGEVTASHTGASGAGEVGRRRLTSG